MARGIIMRIASEFSYVKNHEDFQIYACKSKGRLRYQSTSPVVGDYVDFEITGPQQGIIENIHLRKNELLRPRIVNIDQVAIITSLKTPNFNSYLLNKYLAFIEYKDLQPLIVFTKIDLLPDDDPIYEKYLNWYIKLGYEVVFISNKIHHPQAWVEFENKLANKITVFTGQTGSGKSTTINSLLQENLIATQEVSYALGRGKHTTTTNELYELFGGMIGDTPGFSSFELTNFSAYDLSISYHCFVKYLGQCKYRGCLHQQEPGCKIKELVELHQIPAFFYQDYQQLISELL